MANPSRASMRIRFLRLLIPMGLVGLVVGFFTWSSLKDGIGNLEVLKHVSELSISTRVHVSDMGSAMKGYLLNPSDQSEYERKKAADDANSAALEKLGKLVSDPEVHQLIEQMAEFDEKELNPAEDKVMNLVKDQHLDEARNAFVSEYLPLRAKYDDLSKKLVEETAKYASEATASVDAGLQRISYTIMALLAGGLLATAILSILSVGQLSREFRIVASGLNNISTRLSGSSESLSTAGVRLADTSTESASALEETTTSIRELNEAFHQNAERSSNAASVSGRSRANAVDGRESVQRMADAINEIENGNSEINARITESNNRISEITAVIGEIGQKTRVINDIVFQTKLLSFNASVEAARAGEHGKGFAVVAEEVGNLARMSGQAAQEISHLLDDSIRKVESIVEDTRRSVEGLMESNRNRVTVGARVADECANALQQIVTAAEESEKLALEISDSTKMQSTRIEAVTAALEQIGKAVHDMADSSHATSEASNGLRTDAAGLLENVRSLSSLVDGSSGHSTHNVVDFETRKSVHQRAA